MLNRHAFYMSLALIAAFGAFMVYGFMPRSGQFPVIPGQQFEVDHYDADSKTLYILVTDQDMLSGSDLGCDEFATMIADIFENPGIDWIVPINATFVPSRTRLIDRSWADFLLAGLEIERVPEWPEIGDE